MVRRRNREEHAQTSRGMLLVRAAMVALVCGQGVTGGAPAATIPVTSVSDALANDGVCTLREAIASATNNMAPFPAPGECPAGDQGSSSQDVISFAIPGAGVHTIAATDGFGVITAPVLIDGYTQPGASPNTLVVGNNAVLRIEIDATSVGGFGLFRIQGLADGSTIRGLVINRVSAPVLEIGSGGLPSDSNVFAGNFVGTDVTGATLFGSNSSTHTSIAINGGNANRIGGSAPADRNVFVGGGGPFGQVFLNSGTPAGNVIAGNYFGTNAAGTQALLPSFPNRGVVVSANGNTIGSPGAGNVIVAHIPITLNGGDDTVVQGNRLGVDPTGTIALKPLEGIGILTANTAANCRIGGVGTAGNVIGNFVFGIQLTDGAPGIRIQGNRIGTDITGTLPMPNGIGITITTESGGSVIGGTGAGEGNVIAFNTDRGITVGGLPGWAILGNSIYGNGGLGISLTGTNVPLPNDPGDADVGANNRQNYPVTTFSDISGANVTIAGTLNSTASTTFRVEIFASASCDPSGFGEGQSFVGAVDVVTNGAGNASFGPLVVAVPTGRKAMTMTATDPGGNTSELSGCVVAGDLFSDGFETGNLSRWSGAVP